MPFDVDKNKQIAGKTNCEVEWKLCKYKLQQNRIRDAGSCRDGDHGMLNCVTTKLQQMMREITN